MPRPGLHCRLQPRPVPLRPLRSEEDHHSEVTGHQQGTVKYTVQHCTCVRPCCPQWRGGIRRWGVALLLATARFTGMVRGSFSYVCVQSRNPGFAVSLPKRSFEKMKRRLFLESHPFFETECRRFHLCELEWRCTTTGGAASNSLDSTFETLSATALPKRRLLTRRGITWRELHAGCVLYLLHDILVR